MVGGQCSYRARGMFAPHLMIGRVPCLRMLFGWLIAGDVARFGFRHIEHNPGGHQVGEDGWSRSVSSR